MTGEAATAMVAEAAVTVVVAAESVEMAAVTAEVATAMVAGAVVKVVVKTAEAVFVRLKEVLVAFLFEVFLLLECAHPFPARVPFP